MARASTHTRARTRTRTHQWSSRECHAINYLPPSLFSREQAQPRSSHFVNIAHQDPLLRKGGREVHPEVQAPSTRSIGCSSGQWQCRRSACVAHTHQQRTQQSREQGEGSSASASAAGVVVVGAGGGAWTTADCCAAHSEAHCTKRCDVGPCSRCATRTFMEGRKRPWKRVRGQGLVAWCLRWIAVGQCLAATHTWKRSCIEGVPPPKGKRGLLALCCCCGGCSKPDGGGGAE